MYINIIVLFITANTRSLIRMVAELQLQMKDILQRIDRITPKTKIVSSTERIKSGLPLKSIEDIINMETRLQQADFVDEYVSKIIRKSLNIIYFFYVLHLSCKLYLFLYIFSRKLFY